MHPSTAVATVLVDELVRGGVREAVLAPGSRSAPLAYALHAADAAGRLRLHVRVDERSAAFLTVGLARASGRPVPVVTTSGTATAHLHAAVLEASHGGVPLLALTADRPAELQGTGANQTTEQSGLYGGAVRLAATVPAGAARPGEVASWRSLACRALAAATGVLSGDPGPVHLNVQLRDPLVPDADAGWVEPVDGRPDGRPWTAVALTAEAPAGGALGDAEPHTLLVLGDAPPDVVAAAHRAAVQRGWPVVSEPTATGPASLAHGVLLLGDAAFLRENGPRRVVVVGRPTLSRAVQRLLSDPQVAVEVVSPAPRWADPTRSARAVHPPAALADVGAAPAVAGRRAWADCWTAAASAVEQALAPTLAASWPSGPAVAREVVAALPSGSLLTLGSSHPVRDVDLAARPRGDVRVLANRGLAGIDGIVSTAVGAALAHDGPGYALLGDLTFLHDANGLLLGPAEPRPDLALVVVNDDGGSIFAALEPGAPEHAGSFERLFGTPTGADLGGLCAAYRTPHERVGSPAELREALVQRRGIRVVEVAVPRDGRRDLAARLRQVAADALAPPP